ncbi:MAG: gliding motility-associated C-terminal domain-containing protein [Saprospiraceae bacterium]|nr:gliding motility-associated C-terminal domain-containing protein [Saprospiraceae bacterium]
MKTKTILFIGLLLLSFNYAIGQNPNPADTVKNNLIVPKVFTPNGDGVNDVFLIQSLDYSALKDFKIIIYNRWGNLVFESDDIKKAWDGKEGKNDLDEGVYVYSFSVKIYNPETNEFEEVEHRGTLTLLR